MFVYQHRSVYQEDVSDALDLALKYLGAKAQAVRFHVQDRDGRDWYHHSIHKFDRRFSLYVKRPIVIEVDA